MSIYDALAREAEKRASRSAEEWIAAERATVLRAAQEAARRLGHRPPTMGDVEKAEI